MVDEKKSINRRAFLSKGIVLAGSLSLFSRVISGPVLAQTAHQAKLDLSSLQGKFQGQLIAPQDPQFNQIAFDGLWNELRPARIPQLIARVVDENDVSAVIKYARANKLKVSVRGGGHSWCAMSNRDGGILIDLANLNKVISIDANNCKAILQPILSNREVQAALKPYGLAYPTGHCPTVKVSGYLLSGGMSWNQGAWGPGVGSVEAVELVTPEGEIITASADQNQDYYWAARGAGPGMFAVVTRYHLKLYPLPKAIVASTYYYPYEDISAVCDWLGPLARTLPNNLELSAGVLAAPPELAEQCKSSNGKVFMVSAVLFADSQEEIQAALNPLDTCPIIGKCLSKSVAKPTNFESLFDASGALWPPGLRCKVDALFYRSSLTETFNVIKDHFLKVTSPEALIFISVFTGKDGLAPLPDAAFSMTAKLYGGPWTMWKEPSADEENKQWHQQCVKLLHPCISGHYISESEIVEHPDYIKASYKEANRKRLAELRTKYDPEGVFFNYSEGLG